jgi:hypothetical protein
MKRPLSTIKHARGSAAPGEIGPWLQPVLGGVLRGRNYERFLHAGSFSPLAVERDELRQRPRSPSLPGLVEADAIAITTPMPADVNAITISDRTDERRRIFHSLPESWSPTTTVVGRVRHATLVACGSRATPCLPARPPVMTTSIQASGRERIDDQSGFRPRGRRPAGAPPAFHCPTFSARAPL